MSCSTSKSSDPRPVACSTHSQLSSKVKRHKVGGTHSVPSLNGAESISAAARVRATYDVKDAIDTITIQKGVKEAERCSSSRDLEVIKE